MSAMKLTLQETLMTKLFAVVSVVLTLLGGPVSAFPTNHFPPSHNEGGNN